MQIVPTHGTRSSEGQTLMEPLTAEEAVMMGRAQAYRFDQRVPNPGPHSSLVLAYSHSSKKQKQKD